MFSQLRIRDMRTFYCCGHINKNKTKDITKPFFRKRMTIPTFLNKVSRCKGPKQSTVKKNNLVKVVAQFLLIVGYFLRHHHYHRCLKFLSSSSSLLLLPVSIFRYYYKQTGRIISNKYSEYNEYFRIRIEIEYLTCLGYIWTRR